MSRVESLTVDPAEADWHSIHEAVDEVFDELESGLQQAQHGLRSRRERVQAAQFQFNYLAIDPPLSGTDRETLVVGLRFEQQSGGVCIRGDISTEETGRVLYDNNCDIEVVRSAAEATEVSRQIARRLANQVALILDYFAPVA